MVEVDLTGIAWVLAGILGGLLTVSVAKNKFQGLQLKQMDPDDFRKRLRVKEDYIKDLEDEIDGYRKEREELYGEIKSWEGKYHQKGQIQKIPGGKYDLQNKSDLGLVLEDLLPKIEGSLPPDIQKIIKDPEIKKKILSYANEHPEEAAKYIQQFIAPAKSAAGKSETNIPGFDYSKAI